MRYRNRIAKYFCILVDAQTAHCQRSDGSKNGIQYPVILLLTLQHRRKRQNQRQNNLMATRRSCTSTTHAKITWVVGSGSAQQGRSQPVRFGKRIPTKTIKEEMERHQETHGGLVDVVSIFDPESTCQSCLEETTAANCKIANFNVG